LRERNDLEGITLVTLPRALNVLVFRFAYQSLKSDKSDKGDERGKSRVSSITLVIQQE
jgi:hypothetical protein